MAHGDAMASRLPLLYRDGELVRQVLDVPAEQIEILDEDAREVQRAHWFDATYELSEAARLAALLDIAPESWQDLQRFRAWVHALRDAMLTQGAVTKSALQGFALEYTRLYQAAVGATFLPTVNLAAPDAVWSDQPVPNRLAFVENPLVRRYDHVPALGGIEPLYAFQIVQKGLDDEPVGFLLTGLPSAPESAPVLVNLTTGQALIYPGSIGPGQRLWLRAAQDGSVQGMLEGQEVTAKLRSVSGLQPGTPWTAAQIQQPARALTLQRGSNTLWFLPVAHYDTPGLDRFLLALADRMLQEGRYEQTQFDHALFYQDPAVLLRVSWLETRPASFEVHLPAGAMVSAPGGLEAALEARQQLESSLNAGVQRLRAAGVAGAALLEPFREQQGATERLTGVMPLVHRERGPTGEDSLPDIGGLFGVTHFEDSTYR